MTRIRSFQNGKIENTSALITVWMSVFSNKSRLWQKLERCWWFMYPRSGPVFPRINWSSPNLRYHLHPVCSDWVSSPVLFVKDTGKTKCLLKLWVIWADLGLMITIASCTDPTWPPCAQHQLGPMSIFWSLSCPAQPYHSELTSNNKLEIMTTTKARRCNFFKCLF